ncbi:unnamed protein product [Chironomus riparius]|uniref:Lipase domain-containing protein n=1 Tax=Chironomus riparius TaxID=315576 RepID=A0A9N9RSZ1_9DIPT|nr:unnamed protein product [Chironomus riparius]
MLIVEMNNLVVFTVLLKISFSVGFDLNKTVACNIQYYFYHGSSLSIYDIKSFSKIIDNPNFDPDKPTTFYIYGTIEGIWVPTVIAVKDAYLANGRHNFIIVGNKNPFLHVFNNALIIADKFSENMLELINSGYDYSKTTFVSFSLGSKAIAPMTSRLIKMKSNNKFKLPKIVALDPGIVRNNELHLSGGERLNSNDADFVMTVHTDCHYWGTKESHGHVNFWINGGCDQPMCVNDFTKSVCNHLMAAYYWAEAVKSDSKTAFKSRQCASWKHYLKKDCDLSLPVAYIGLYTQANITGDYYVRTKKVVPYSRS